MTVDPALAAINFAIHTDEGIEFLRAWTHGEWDVIRREWPEAPETVYVPIVPTIVLTVNVTK